MPIVVVVLAAGFGLFYWRQRRGVLPFDARKPFAQVSDDGMEEVMMDK